MANSETQPGHFTGAFDLLGKSVELIQKNLKVFLILNAFTILSALAQFFPSNDSPTSGAPNLNTPFDSAGVVAGLVGGAILLVIAFVILSIVLETMLTGLGVKASEGKTPSLGELWDFVKNKVVRLFGLSLLTGLIIVVGLLLLIVPGLIFFRWYLLAPYFLIDKNLSITEAMAQSKAASQKNPGALWSLIGVTFLFMLPAFFTSTPVLPLISIVLLTLYTFAPAIRYQEFKKVS